MPEVSDVPYAGRVALVTGGSRGIGRALVQHLSSRGAEVISVQRSQTAPAGVAWQYDLSRSDEIELLAERVRDLEIDILVNNAGSAHVAAIEAIELPPALEDIVLNLAAPLMLSAAVLASMTARGRGVIVNIGSTAGLRGVPALAAYGAAKAGLINLTQSLARAAVGSGVSVNCICVGAVDTAAGRRVRREISEIHRHPPEQYQAEMLTRAGLRRMVEPGDIIPVFDLLALQREPTINGQLIQVCGLMEA